MFAGRLSAEKITTANVRLVAVQPGEAAAASLDALELRGHVWLVVDSEPFGVYFVSFYDSSDTGLGIAFLVCVCVCVCCLCLFVFVCVSVCV